MCKFSWKLFKRQDPSLSSIGCPARRAGPRPRTGSGCVRWWWSWRSTASSTASTAWAAPSSGRPGSPALTPGQIGNLGHTEGLFSILQIYINFLWYFGLHFVYIRYNNYRLNCNDTYILSSSRLFQSCNSLLKFSTLKYQYLITAAPKQRVSSILTELSPFKTNLRL